MAGLTGHLRRAVRAVVPSVVDVSIGDSTNKGTWTVTPSSLQAQAQPVIDGFNPDDPAHAQADLDEQIAQALDQERIFSAVVWAIIDQVLPPATIAKYNAARTKIVNAYKNRPWMP